MSNAAAEPAERVASALTPWICATLRLEGAAHQTQFSPPRIDQGPTIDGVLNEEAWSHAALLESFTHNRPIEGYPWQL